MFSCEVCEFFKEYMKTNTSVLTAALLEERKKKEMLIWKENIRKTYSIVRYVIIGQFEKQILKNHIKWVHEKNEKF